MAYYDRIASQWHEVTGHSGGAFKKHVLNDVLLDAIGTVAGRSILELGAGNGYFVPMMLRRFSGQQPSRIVVSDQSSSLLDIARRHFRSPGAEYLKLDVRAPLPFVDRSFDLILATMVLNELTGGGVRRALAESCRVLSLSGRLIVTVSHPDFILTLSKRGLLRSSGRGVQTMPGARGLRLPVVRRSRGQYERLLRNAGLVFEAKDVYPDARVLSAKPVLKEAGDVPLALVFACSRAHGEVE